VTSNEGAAGFFYGSTVHVHPAPNAARAASNWPRRIGVVPAPADCRQRRQIAEKLRATARDGSTLVRCHVLSGLGGVGKTQLAAEFAEQAWRDGKVDLLMWVSATSRVAILSAYSRAFADLTGVEPADPAEGAARFLAWLAEPHGRRWLIVVDELAAPGDLTGLWPPSTAGGRVLVTTRRQDAALAAEGRRIINVGLFTPGEAHRYLRQKLSDDPTRLDEPEQLAADLGYLPLALAQAAAYLLDRRLTCAGYRRRFAERKRKLADLVPETEALPDSQTATIAVTWSLSIEAADRLTPAGRAGPLLQLASFLNPNGIPVTVLAAGAWFSAPRGHDPKPTTDDIVDGLHNLQRLSLLTIEGEAVRVHRLVQRATRDALPCEQARTIAHTAADALVRIWPSSNGKPVAEEGLRANAEALLDYSGDMLWQPDAHPVLFRAGHSLDGLGHVHAAVTYWTNVLVTAHRVLGLDHPANLSIRHNLAGSRGQAGDPAGAAAEYGELLREDERIHGADHPDALQTRANHAYWRGLAGDPVGAATALAELLADQLRILGADHELTLVTRHNLARMRGEAGDPAGATTAYQELLPDQIRILGKDHPHTIATRNNLAVLLAKTHDPTSAAVDLQRILADCVRTLGPKHPDTLATRGEVNSLSHPSDPTPHKTLVTDCEEVLGPDHPMTLRARANLARSHGYAGDPGATAAAHEALVRDYSRVLGPNHVDTLITRYNAAHWLDAAGYDAGAGTALRCLLNDITRVFGPDHPHTRRVEQRLDDIRKRAALSEITNILRGAGVDVDSMLADPLTYWQREHAKAIRDLGADHPMTQLIQARLAPLRASAEHRKTDQIIE
jgi:hypothetical protein